MGSYRRNDVYIAVTRVLDDRKIDFSTSITRRSVRINFDFHGQKLRVNTPLTPSDHRAPKKAESWLRRLLRSVETGDVAAIAASAAEGEGEALCVKPPQGKGR